MTSDLHKLNFFMIRVGRIHRGYKELSGSSMDYRKAGLALIEQGISDTLCSIDTDLIPWDILDQVEVFFRYLDQHIIDDIGFWDYKTDDVPDRVLDLPAGILDFLDDFLLTADAQAQRFERTTAYYEYPDPPPKKRKTSLRLTGQADRMFLDKKTIINEVQPI